MLYVFISLCMVAFAGTLALAATLAGLAGLAVCYLALGLLTRWLLGTFFKQQYPALLTQTAVRHWALWALLWPVVVAVFIDLVRQGYGSTDGKAQIAVRKPRKEKSPPKAFLQGLAFFLALVLVVALFPPPRQDQRPPAPIAKPRFEPQAQASPAQPAGRPGTKAPVELPSKRIRWLLTSEWVGGKKRTCTFGVIFCYPNDVWYNIVEGELNTRLWDIRGWWFAGIRFHEVYKFARADVVFRPMEVEEISDYCGGPGDGCEGYDDEGRCWVSWMIGLDGPRLTRQINRQLGLCFGLPEDDHGLMQYSMWSTGRPKPEERLIKQVKRLIRSNNT